MNKEGIKSIESIVMYGRPVIKISDYELVKDLEDWQYRFKDGDEIFIIPDDFWDKFPQWLEKQKEIYGQGKK